MNVCSASPHCPTIIDGSVGTTMNTASSAGPMRRGRSVQRRPRNRLAANQVTIEAATTNAATARLLPTLQWVRSRALSPSSR